MTADPLAQPRSGPNRLSPSPASQTGRRSLEKGDVPTEVLDRYLIERDRLGRPERFFRDHQAAQPMFRDMGRALTADRTYPDTVATMLKIATHRGWSAIRVSGDDAFRREVWVQGRGLGLEVRGHRPSDRDRQAAGTPDRPAPSDREATADAALRRREMAAVVVRTLIADPAAQARLLDRLGLRTQDRTTADTEPGRANRERYRTR